MTNKQKIIELEVENMQDKRSIRHLEGELIKDREKIVQLEEITCEIDKLKQERSTDRQEIIANLALI